MYGSFQDIQKAVKEADASLLLIEKSMNFCDLHETIKVSHNERKYLVSSRTSK